MGPIKKEALGYLKTKIRDMLARWRLKILNQAGKERLMKATIMTIHTYMMSMFNLLKTWFFEINLLIVDFW